jgi:hypothetical protein
MSWVSSNPPVNKPALLNNKSTFLVFNFAARYSTPVKVDKSASMISTDLAPKADRQYQMRFFFGAGLSKGFANASVSACDHDQLIVNFHTYFASSISFCDSVKNAFSSPGFIHSPS